MSLLSGSVAHKISNSPVAILVLCTGNSARSVMAEALFNHLGAGRFCTFSAGSHPTGRVNPYAEEQIAKLGSAPVSPRSKSWNEFSGGDAPALDIVLTVCSNADAEHCPQFKGAPERVHWDFPDPAAAGGDAEAIRGVFAVCFAELERRIGSLIQQTQPSTSRADMAAVMRALADTVAAGCESTPQLQS